MIADDASAPDIVSLGRTVIVREAGTEFEGSYTIVGPPEADPAKGRISNESPIGSALLGAKKGQTVSAQTPAGQINFKIHDIA